MAACLTVVPALAPATLRRADSTLLSGGGFVVLHLELKQLTAEGLGRGATGRGAGTWQRRGRVSALAADLHRPEAGPGSGADGGGRTAAAAVREGPLNPA